MIDPHGDLEKDVIAQAPQARMHQLFLLDMEDEDFPFGVNVFADALFDSDMDRSRAIARVTNIFNVLWPETQDQATLPIYLKAAIVTLLSNPGSTLVDMLALFSDAGFRQRMVQNVAAEDVRKQWREYDEGGKSTANEAAALVRRLKLLFMGRDLIKNVVGQRQTSINFRKAIEQRQIILIKLPVNEVDEDARLVGTFLMSQLTYAIFSFSDTDPARRPGVTVVVDEFQNFVTPDAERIFTQGRKFGARLIVAHQQRSQMPEFLQDATMTARTVVAFRTVLDDSRKLAPLFHSTTTSVEVSRNAVKSLLDDPPKDRDVEHFIEYYLRPLKGWRSGKQVKVTNAGTDVWGAVMDVASALFGPSKYKPVPVEAPDPTGRLNDLLREVMQTGNPDLPIHPDIPYGFCNGGVGFLAIARKCRNDPALSPDFAWPGHLVSDAQWVYKPVSPREQFYHFLFYLRVVMAYLAAHPVGKVTTAGSDNVAQSLAQLPVHHAFVQTSEGIGYIRTLDTTTPCSDDELEARLFFVREQTRQTYCHPRPKPEPMTRQPVAPQPILTDSIQPVSGWGQISEP